MKVSESTNALFTNSQSFGYSQTKERGNNDCNKKSHCVDKGVSDSTETGTVMEKNGGKSDSFGTHASLKVSAEVSADIPLVASVSVKTEAEAGINTNSETRSGKKIKSYSLKN